MKQPGEGGSMHSFDNWIAPLIVGALLLVPFLYGLATPSGMREKWIYPLLRWRKRDGPTASVVLEDRRYSVAQLGESSPPLKLERRAFYSIQ
jgi:hypothetical protein